MAQTTLAAAPMAQATPAAAAPMEAEGKAPQESEIALTHTKKELDDGFPPSPFQSAVRVKVKPNVVAEHDQFYDIPELESILDVCLAKYRHVDHAVITSGVLQEYVEV